MALMHVESVSCMPDVLKRVLDRRARRAQPRCPQKGRHLDIKPDSESDTKVG